MEKQLITTSAAEPNTASASVDFLQDFVSEGDYPAFLTGQRRIGASDSVNLFYENELYRFEVAPRC